MIIVEGPDGAGKTTLVNELLKEFDDLTLGPRATDDRDKLYEVTVEDTFNALSEAVRCRKGEAKIWDRLFYSEFVYAPVTDRDCAFNEDQQSYINRIIQYLGIPIIICLPPLEVVKQNLGDKQMEGVTENIDQIYELYADAEWWPPAMLYDYTGQAPLRRDDRMPFSLHLIKQNLAHYFNTRRLREW